VCVPSELAESVIIFGVNDGEFLFCEGYFSEGVAIPDASQYEQDCGESDFDAFLEFEEDDAENFSTPANCEL